MLFLYINMGKTVYWNYWSYNKGASLRQLLFTDLHLRKFTLVQDSTNTHVTGNALHTGDTKMTT